MSQNFSARAAMIFSNLLTISARAFSIVAREYTQACDTVATTVSSSSKVSYPGEYYYVESSLRCYRLKLIHGQVTPHTTTEPTILLHLAKKFLRVLWNLVPQRT